jgi:hypothetical protein
MIYRAIFAVSVWEIDRNANCKYLIDLVLSGTGQSMFLPFKKYQYKRDLHIRILEDFVYTWRI